MQIEIVDVKVENKGKYRQATVSYKGPQGKIDGKKIMSFTYKDVYKVLSEAKPGDIFEVKSEKNEKTGFWDWTEIKGEGKNTGSVSGERFEKAINSSRSTYETPEERAKKQVYIVRQSSVANAIEFLKACYPDGVLPEDVREPQVIAVAKEFEAYVFDIGAPTPAVEVGEAEVK